MAKNIYIRNGDDCLDVQERASGVNFTPTSYLASDNCQDVFYEIQDNIDCNGKLFKSVQLESSIIDTIIRTIRYMDFIFVFRYTEDDFKIAVDVYSIDGGLIIKSHYLSNPSTILKDVYIKGFKIHLIVQPLGSDIYYQVYPINTYVDLKTTKPQISISSKHIDNWMVTEGNTDIVKFLNNNSVIYTRSSNSVHLIDESTADVNDPNGVLTNSINMYYVCSNIFIVVYNNSYILATVQNDTITAKGVSQGYTKNFVGHGLSPIDGCYYYSDNNRLYKTTIDPFNPSIITNDLDIIHVDFINNIYIWTLEKSIYCQKNNRIIKSKLRSNLGDVNKNMFGYIENQYPDGRFICFGGESVSGISNQSYIYETSPYIKGYGVQ